MEIELNFRLDGDGRTADPNDTGENNATATNLDYTSKATMTNLATSSSDKNDEDSNSPHHQQWLDDLLFDCEIADCGLMPRTFWMPAEGMKPRCSLEQFALDVFHHHVPPGLKYDPKKSGAEWWPQLRPSPEGTGRYSMHDPNPDEISKTGISFHWDKDEDLRILLGGSTYIHPHLSTVTYLTDFGSPTLVLNCRVHNLTGDWVVPGVDDMSKDDHVEGFVSWPKTGKHMSFDGRYLHSAPPNLMETGAFTKQIQYTKVDDAKQEKLLRRRHRRVTFLVNIWLNYEPFEVKPFPKTMIDKLSGGDEATRKNMMFNSTGSVEATKVKSVSTSKTCVNEAEERHEGKTGTPTRFIWSMGDCDSDETIQAQMPLDSIRKQASHGGNVRIRWEEEPSEEASLGCGFALFKGQQPSTENQQPGPEKRASQSQGADDDDNDKKRTRTMDS